MKNIFHKSIFLLTVYLILTMTTFGGEGQCPRHNQGGEGGGLTGGSNHTEQQCPDKTDDRDNSEEGLVLEGFDFSSVDNHIIEYLNRFFQF